MLKGKGYNDDGGPRINMLGDKHFRVTIIKVGAGFNGPTRLHNNKT